MKEPQRLDWVPPDDGECVGVFAGSGFSILLVAIADQPANVQEPPAQNSNNLNVSKSTSPVAALRAAANEQRGEKGRQVRRSVIMKTEEVNFGRERIDSAIPPPPPFEELEVLEKMQKPIDAIGHKPHPNPSNRHSRNLSAIVDASKGRQSIPIMQPAPKPQTSLQIIVIGDEAEVDLDLVWEESIPDYMNWTENKDGNPPAAVRTKVNLKVTLADVRRSTAIAIQSSVRRSVKNVKPSLQGNESVNFSFLRRIGKVYVPMGSTQGN